ncbi:hypothetical protein [Rhizobium sp. ZX09]|uniref:hypothetical protein n=1 Tax=Rhizobium sp. ZX09 TaxID=2291939 RepID=UPI001FF02600|nr:hypothetical protein [Rhizobium sp. ZX09]
MVDFLSIILAAIGWEKDRSSKVSERRIEAYRLNAEVAAEAAQCVNMLSLATPDLLRRVEAQFPGQPAIYQSVHDTLTTMRSQAEQIYLMAEGYKPTIERTSTWTDWEKALSKLHEWRATASMLRPQTASIIDRYETLLASAGSPPPAVAAPVKDRGWNAPPL